MVPDLGHVHAHDGPLQQCHKGFQGATPRTRPLATTPSWPPGLGLSGQANTGRGLQFLHAQSRAPLQSNPQRASQRLCRRPAHPALRVFYTPMQPCMNVTSTFPEPAPAPSQAMDTHSQGCPGSSVNSESSKVGAHDTTHPAGVPHVVERCACAALNASLGRTTIPVLDTCGPPGGRLEFPGSAAQLQCCPGVAAQDPLITPPP